MALRDHQLQGVKDEVRAPLVHPHLRCVVGVAQSKALEQHKCGHTSFLITWVVNKLCISFIPVIISYGG